MRPVGAWLAERVWEPDLPTSLVAAGYDWTILDDAHFRSAAIPEEDLWGPYTTEDQGQLLRVFGTEQGLRYRIPFRNVEEVIDYLRQHATEDGDRVGMMGDDGEKFGAWPTTWEHCWGERQWVNRFFEALEENGDWLTTTTPTDWLADHAPIGRVYVPTGSYAEMGEWALPPDESVAFATALHAAVAKHRPEARWLRGAFWRNYQVRYREINDMHKQMLRTSDLVDAMTEGDDRTRALDHLYQGQSNDTYWHGLFGGIYISHMRLATYEHLIAAEDLAETDAGRLHEAERLDLDLDGHDEVRLSGPGQVVSIDLAEGAGIGGWDIRPVRHNVCSVMRRRPEAYHQKLRDHVEGEASPDPAPAATDAPTSIHEIFLVKEPGLAAMLHYDPYERRSGLVRFLAPGTNARRVGDRRGRRAERCRGGRLRDREARARPARRAARRLGVDRTDGASAAVRVVKTFTLGGDRRSPLLTEKVVVTNRSESTVEAVLGLEWTATMLGGGGNPAAWLEIDGERTTHDAHRTATGQTSVSQGNDTIGIAITTRISPAADVWCAPVETVSNSEAGFERVYQGAGMLLTWPLSLAGGASQTVTVRHAVATARDRAEEERNARKQWVLSRMMLLGVADPG